MARIVLDGTYAHAGGTGLARYAREVLARLLRRLDDHELIVVTTPSTALPESPATILAPGAVAPERVGPRTACPVARAGTPPHVAATRVRPVLHAGARAAAKGMRRDRHGA